MIWNWTHGTGKLEGVSNTAMQPYFKKSGVPALEENLDDARSTDFTCKS
jgi:hypothetical protein